MVTKQKQIMIRAPKEDVFNVLKNLSPALFGDKVWADVESFGRDPDDDSYFKLIFKEEDDS